MDTFEGLLEALYALWALLHDQSSCTMSCSRSPPHRGQRRERCARGHSPHRITRGGIIDLPTSLALPAQEMSRATAALLTMQNQFSSERRRFRPPNHHLNILVDNIFVRYILKQIHPYSRPQIEMNVKTLCLGALSLGDKSGYDIKKLFETAFSHFHTATYGAIYPALRQLERDGLIIGRTEPGARHPDRKLYRLTDEGQEALRRELMAEAPNEQLRSEFLVLTFFSHLLPAERVAELLADVRDRYASKLAYLESKLDLPGHTPGTRFTVQASIAHYRAMLSFLAEQGPRLLREHRHGDAAEEEDHA
jgi:DNA-binding PadR family transcriptional regulator